MTQSKRTLAARLTEVQQDVALFFRDTLPTGSEAGAARISQVMHYSTLAGGKRVRPLVLLEAYRLMGGQQPEQALRAAAALEAIHTFSLMHDDLPCIDNDTLRRGKPTAHVQFDEATAVLGGDALLNWAYTVLSDPATHACAEVRCQLIQLTSRATHAMIDGEMWDILIEQGGHLSATELAELQDLKTGALFQVCVELAAYLVWGVAEGVEAQAQDKAEHVAALRT
jgi:Geranylgeranyl pyrophosphate synthase